MRDAACDFRNVSARNLQLGRFEPDLLLELVEMHVRDTPVCAGVSLGIA